MVYQTDSTVFLEVCYFIFMAIFPSCNPLCLDVGTLTDNDVYLENNLLGFTKEPSIMDCATTCATHTDCEYFGFEPRQHSCHLHSQSADPLSQLVDAAGWYHGDVNTWPQAVLGPCSSLQCGSGERCRIHRVMKTPFCDKVTLDLPVDTCSVPPSLLNADISSGNQQVGSNRTYSCHHGYLDLTFDTTNATITCLEGREWSNATLNCMGPYVRFETYDIDRVYFPFPAETLYNLTGNTSSLVFLVKTCTDSNFVFYQGSDYTVSDSVGDLYEVVMGGWVNYRTVIRSCRDHTCGYLAEYRESGMLSCSEFRPFWLSWSGGVIAVGKGNVVGEQTIVEAPDPVPFEIENIAYSSYINNMGVWLFSIQA